MDMDGDGVISLLSDDENGISNVQHHGHQTRKRGRSNDGDCDGNNSDDDNNDSDYEEEEEEHDEIINNNSKPQKCVGLDDGPCTGYCALTFSGSSFL